MRTPTETQPPQAQTLLGAALHRSRCASSVNPLEVHGEAIVELLSEIATTLRELPLAAEGNRNYEDARRYRFLKEHWPKDWSVEWQENGTVFIVGREDAKCQDFMSGLTLDAALDGLMPGM